MSENDKHLTTVMNSYDRGEIEKIDVAIVMTESCGTCSKETYDKVDKIFKIERNDKIGKIYKRTYSQR